MSELLPRYQQLALELRQQIAQGVLPAGAQLPTEAALGTRYNVARGTVRRAIAQLEAAGLIRTEHGIGSFVSAAPSNAVTFRFAEADSDKLASELSYQTLAQELLPASIALAAQLKVMPGVLVLHLAQRVLAGAEAIAYTERYLPESLCPGLATADLTRRPVRDILAASAVAPPVRAVIEVEARQLGAADAQRLGVVPGTPVIVVSRMSYTAPTQPAVWYRGLFRHSYRLGVLLEGEG